ncbi:polysaccharide biosynthesis tyrosine autokinase [Agrobacterium cavarae]|uniref:polysaccharide biosynthesis tyrosine autokinase n=1 Tax=Agrobacterium cavarae TaxID=2528239 RepID=UPI0035E41C4D
MLHKPFHGNEFRDEQDTDVQPQLVDIEAIIGIVRRQWLVVAAFVFVGILFAILYIASAVPLYTSQASVLIDREGNQLASQLSTISTIMDDEASVLSQVELFTSDAIGLETIVKLDLLEDPEFMAQSTSMISNVLRWGYSLFNISGAFTSADFTAEQQEMMKRNALRRLQAFMDVQRVGRTYILQISYTSPFPNLSAKIANGIADAYLVDKLNSKYEATRRAGEWLQNRIAELRQQALNADLAVQRFRASNGLVAAGNQLVSDQKLSELNTALIAAQAETANARARLERIQDIIRSGQTDAIVTDVLGSSISNDLRQKYLNASKLETEITRRLGSDHTQAVRLRREMDEYKRLMFEELNRIAQSYASDLQVAQAREKSLSDSVLRATDVSTAANETQVQLRELEREAETYKNLYQTFLQRYQEAVQQQSFPVTDARVVKKATASGAPSSPNKLLSLAVFIFLGAGVGSAIGGLREYRDRFFRTGDHVRTTLGLEYLGSAPLVVDAKKPRATTEVNPRTIHTTSAVVNYTVEHPLSSFAETMRSIKIAADLTINEKSCKVIGVVSALPGEGKSTVSINFAQLLASQGSKTVLIDADFRNPGATRALSLHAREGVLEALIDNKPVKELMVWDTHTHLGFLPAVIKQRVPHSSELLTSNAMRKLIEELSNSFDYIVLDLPPLGAVVDARAMANRVDGFVFVAEWGKTARRAVRQLLASEPMVRNNCIGVVLNKVDSAKMKLYRPYGSAEYYETRYNQYYQES